MKKKFIKYAPMITSRYMRGARNSGGVCYLSDAPENDKRTEEQLLEKIKGSVSEQLATRASKEELEIIKQQVELLKSLPIAQLRDMADANTGAMALLTAQGLELTRLKATQDAQPKEFSVRSQVAAWQEKNKETIQKIMNGEKASLEPMEIRAVASPMSVATVNPDNSPYIGRVEIEPGINDFIRATPVFWDFLVKGRTNAPTYGWVNKTNPQGAAAFIGPGVAKPGVSFSLEAEVSTAKKIADSAKATTELLQDIDGMTTFIEQELKYQVMIKVNSTLMDSVGTSTVPTGIKQLSVAYTLDSVKTTNPNNFDAIRAVVAQLRSGWLNGDITVFINSIDAANMDLAKATDSGVYMLPPFSSNDGKRIGGARVIEDNNVPVGTIQAGFMRYYRILIYKGFSVSWGWENDDFTKNLVTAVGEMRLHQFFNEIYTGAFVRDTFDNVREAIDEGVAA